MSIGFVFWLLILLWLIFSLWSHYPFVRTPNGFGVMGSSFLMFVLLCLLGWGVFGSPIQGGGAGGSYRHSQLVMPGYILPFNA